MNNLIAFFAFSIFSVFPGVLVYHFISKHFSIATNCIVIVFISLSFWVILPWFVFAFQGNLFLVSSLVLILSALFGIVQFWKRKEAKKFGTTLFKGIQKFGALWLLLLYFFPLGDMLLPPGNDAAMHGYISRLIVNNQGLPSSYNPLLPIQEFGSYSAGYHSLAAYFSFFNEQYLVKAINLTTVSVYLLFALGLAVLLSLFVRKNIAFLAAVISVLMSRVPQGSFGWGGNSTVLAFAFIFIAFFLFIVAYRRNSLVLFTLTAFPLAAVPLTHAIPAIGLFYLTIPLFILVFFTKRANKSLLLRGALITNSMAVFFLLPFAFIFHDPTNQELLDRIREWQSYYGPEHKEHWWQDIVETFKYIQYQLSDPLYITTIAVLVFLVLRRRYFTVILSLFIMFIVFLLVHNTHNWYLPFSHLIYPDRIVYFFLFPVAFIFGEFGQLNFKGNKAWQLTRMALLIYFIIVTPMQFWNFYLKQRE